MLSNVEGQKYPDDYVIKAFFKTGLHKDKKTVIELGCGDGNNLMLFREFGWSVVGVDYNIKSLKRAKKNLNLIKQKKDIKLISQDLTFGLGKKFQKLNYEYDAILLPNILYYLSRDSVKMVLNDIKNVIKPGTFVFSRTRTPQDYRYAKGKKKERNGYILNITETGEFGLLNIFYSKSEIMKMLNECLGLDLKTATVLKVIYENVQKGKKIINSDLVVWGQTSRF